MRSEARRCCCSAGIERGGHGKGSLKRHGVVAALYPSRVTSEHIALGFSTTSSRAPRGMVRAQGTRHMHIRAATVAALAAVLLITPLGAQQGKFKVSTNT